MMFASIAKALAQLPEARLRNTVFLSVLASLGLIIGLAFLTWFAIDMWGVTSIPFIGEALAVLGAVAVAGLTLMFFTSTVTIISGLFLDRVAEAVESKHYPNAGPARGQPLAEVLISAAGLAAVAIGLNILVLPLYFIAGPIVFYALNGYLLGREFFEMVAARRLEVGEVVAMRKAYRFRIFFAGVLIALYMTVPILNLTGPVVATAFMLHVFQRLRGLARG